MQVVKIKKIIISKILDIVYSKINHEITTLSYLDDEIKKC